MLKQAQHDMVCVSPIYTTLRNALQHSNIDLIVENQKKIKNEDKIKDAITLYDGITIEKLTLLIIIYANSLFFFARLRSL